MKAFVIKVKENCYWLGGFYGKNNYDDIAHAKVYVNKTQAEKQCKLVNESYGHNAEVVEITIAEGDLEKEIRKQVCDEIMEELKENVDCYFEERKCNSPHSQLPYIWFNEIRFRKFLDQIEQAKESINGKQNN